MRCTHQSAPLATFLPSCYGVRKSRCGLALATREESELENAGLTKINGAYSDQAEGAKEK